MKIESIVLVLVAGCGGAPFTGTQEVATGGDAPIITGLDAGGDAGHQPVDSTPPRCMLFSAAGQIALMVQCPLGGPQTMYDCPVAAPDDQYGCIQPYTAHPGLFCCD